MCVVAFTTVTRYHASAQPRGGCNGTRACPARLRGAEAGGGARVTRERASPIQTLAADRRGRGARVHGRAIRARKGSDCHVAHEANN